MKTPDPNPLLKEILGGEELSEFRQAALEHGLAAMRRQQRHRRGRRLGALLLLPLLVVFAMFLRRGPVDAPRQLAATNSPRSAAATVTTDSRDPRLISDEELFALFPNRPLALVGQPGRQQLVFLDAPPRRRHP